MNVLKPLLAQIVQQLEPAADRSARVNRLLELWDVARIASQSRATSVELVRGHAGVRREEQLRACPACRAHASVFMIVREERLERLALASVAGSFAASALHPIDQRRRPAPASAARTTACRRCRRSRCARRPARNPGRLLSSRARRNRGSRIFAAPSFQDGRGVLLMKASLAACASWTRLRAFLSPSCRVPSLLERVDVRSCSRFMSMLCKVVSQHAGDLDRQCLRFTCAVPRGLFAFLAQGFDLAARRARYRT